MRPAVTGGGLLVELVMEECHEVWQSSRCFSAPETSCAVRLLLLLSLLFNIFKNTLGSKDPEG